MEIQGSIALVTGANRGLGRALVDALLEAGAARVYAAARDITAIVAHPRVVPLMLDITLPDHLAALAADAPDITVLLNNAGVLSAYDVLTASIADLEADLRTNALGTLGVTRALLPTLARAPGRAAVVNVLSLAALASVPSMGGYAASKAASYSMTQALRPALRRQGIQLLAALCGPVDTDMVAHIPLQKALPADVARAILLGLSQDQEEIFPDPMAVQLGALWAHDPKSLECALSTY